MKLVIEKTAVVITPSVASLKLLRCVNSVESQTHKNLQHLVVYDGRKDYDLEFDDEHPKVIECTLPFNTGMAPGGPFYGHRVYAGFAHLVNADYIFFCDEDNFYEPDHVKNAIAVFEQNQHVQIVYSLRKIHDKIGEYLCHDNCESLGTHLAFTGRHLADTSSLAFRRNFLVQTGYLWHSGWGGDARYLDAVTRKWEQTQHIMGTGKHTLCYRLDGNPNSVTKEFFDRGNAEMIKHFGSEKNFPWVNHSS